MCKLNVYMIDKFVPGIEVKEIFGHHHHKTFENINSEIELKDYDDKYNYYEASAGRCDCSSVVGLLSDYKDKFSTYVDYLKSIGKDDIVKLYEIKKILQDPDYEKNLDQVLTIRDKLFARLENHRKDLKDLELKRSELMVTSKPNIQDQIEIKKLTSEIEKEKERLNNDNEYKVLSRAYEKFIEVNQPLILSRNYTLENKKDWWQENIDLKISKVEHESHMHINAEFNHLKFIINDVLKLTPEVKIFSFWQEDEWKEYDNLKEVKTISINDLSLDDLLYLDLREVVTITRSN